MRIIKPSYEILNEPDWAVVLQHLESAGRTCYKSESKITPDSANKFVRGVIARGHESVLEHWMLTIKLICDRGVSHEIVRHRIGSYSQESTRYVNYSPEGGKGDMQFILPRWMSEEYIGIHDHEDKANYNEICCSDQSIWMAVCARSCNDYNKLIGIGWKPEQARSVLPNSLKTEIVVSTNMRDWRHIFHLRCDKTAHPQMRELMVPLWQELVLKCPPLFDSVQFNMHEEDRHNLTKIRTR